MMKTLSKEDMSLVEELTITFPVRIEVDLGYNFFRITHLPHLRSLNLGRLMSPGVTQCVIDHVLSRLDMPLLENLSFGLDNFWEADGRDLLLLQWFHSKTFEALKKVFVDVCENVKPGKMSRDRFNAMICRVFTKPRTECSSSGASTSSTTLFRPQIFIRIIRVNPDSRPISFRNANEGKNPRSRFDCEYDSDWRMTGGYRCRNSVFGERYRCGCVECVRQDAGDGECGA